MWLELVVVGLVARPLKDPPLTVERLTLYPVAPNEAFQFKVACELLDTAVSPVGVGGGTPLTNPTMKDSAIPTELLWAIKELAPPFGAVTYLLLFIARRPMLPLPASTSVKVSQLPTAVRFAINGLAPLLSAQT